MNGIAHTTNDTVQPELLVALQRGLPLVGRPFAAIGDRVGASETAVMNCVAAMIERGAARRFGGVFDARSLGYDSTLCAADVPERSIEEVAARLAPHAGITHCYEREGRPNLWFTLTAPNERIDVERAQIAEVLCPFELLDLPALRTFKIEAVFDTRLLAGHADAPATHSPAGHDSPPMALDARERAVVRRLQRSIPVAPEPFAVLGAELGWTPDDLLALLAAWQQSGILRRIGLIVRHRELGFAANGMCVWAADAERTVEAGPILAGFPEVTHCYERTPHVLFPFNLFAMIHAGTRDDLHRVRDRLAVATGLAGGPLLMTGREFKKSSPRFFEEA